LTTPVRAATMPGDPGDAIPKGWTVAITVTEWGVGNFTAKDQDGHAVQNGDLTKDEHLLGVVLAFKMPYRVQNGDFLLLEMKGGEGTKPTDKQEPASDLIRFKDFSNPKTGKTESWLLFYSEADAPAGKEEDDPLSDVGFPLFDRD